MGQLPESVPPDGLIGFWPLDGDASDLSVNEFDGIVINAVPTLDRFGQQDRALLFSGDTTYAIIPDSLFGPLFGDFTISFWLKSDKRQRMEPLVVSDSLQYNYNLNISINDDAACWAYWNGFGYPRIKSGHAGQLTNGMWHNLTIRRKEYITSLYFDGKSVGQYEDFVAPIGNLDNIILSNPAYPWIGALDDLVIYNRALTTEEIETFADPPMLAFTEPTAYDAFPLNYNATVTWLKPKTVAATKLEYSVDNGLTWNRIDDHIDSLVTSMVWMIPPLPDHSCILRLTDLSDLNNIAISDTFLISPYQWEQVSPQAPFSRRDGVGAYVLNDKMYMAGGWDPINWMDYPLVTNSEVWESSDGVNWSMISVAPWAPRHTYGSVVFDNKMWVIGGDQLQCGFQRDIWSSSDGVTWDLVNESAPWGDRMLHMYFVFDNKMWVMGGQKIVHCDNTEAEAYNDIWNSEDGITWTQVSAGAAWTPRGMMGGSCVFNDKIWLFGGGVYKTDFHNDVWNSDDGIHWNLVDEVAPWAQRYYHSVIVYDSAMWIIGGLSSGGDLNDTWYTRDGLNWHNLRGTPWPVRHAPSAFDYQNSLWLAAGYLHNDVWKLKSIPCADAVLASEMVQVTLGNSVAVTVTYVTENASFRWQQSIADGWEDLNESDSISGTASNVLQIDSATFALNNTTFRVLAKDGHCSDTTNHVRISVCASIPSITKHPQSITIDENLTGFISIQADDPHTTFQWQEKTSNGWANLEDSQEITGVKSDTLRIESATFDLDNTLIRCVVGEEFCATESNVALISICPNLLKQPKDQVVIKGDDAEFEVKYRKSGAHYQWQTFQGEWVDLSDGAGVIGATTPNLKLPNLKSLQSGTQFRCVITSGSCLTYSDPAMLFVICGQLKDDSVATSQFVSEGSDLVISPGPVDPEMIYYWEYYQTDTWALYSNELSGEAESLTLTNLQLSETLAQFRLIGRDSDGCEKIIHQAAIAVCPDFINESPSIETSEGKQASFWVDVGSDIVAYQWQVQEGALWENIDDNALFAGTQTDSLIVAAADMSLHGKNFRCRVVAGGCAIESHEVSLSICPLIHEQPESLIVISGTSAKFSVGGYEKASYQWQSFSGTDWQDILDGTSIHGAQSQVLVFDSAKHELSIRCVMKFEACETISKIVKLEVCPSLIATNQFIKATGGDTVLISMEVSDSGAALLWQTRIESEFTDLTESASYQGVHSPTLTLLDIKEHMTGAEFRLTARTDRCHVSSEPVTLTVIPRPCPEIILQPADITVMPDGSATFRVEYHGDPTMFQWQMKADTTWVDLKDTVFYQGSNSPELSIQSGQPLFENREFRCVVYGHACILTSEAAQLRIDWVTGLGNSRVTPIFPNPATSQLTLINSSTRIREFVISSPVGTVVMAGRLESGRNDIDISALPSGTYFIEVESANVEKLMVSK